MPNKASTQRRVCGQIDAVDAATSGGIDSSTVLLLHCDGADGGTTFTDNSWAGDKTMTLRGDVHTETDDKQFGTASAYFDYTGDSMKTNSSADFGFGTGDFTIDMWVNNDATQRTNAVQFNNWSNTGSWAANKWSVHVSHSSNTTKWTVWCYNYNSGVAMFTSTTGSKGGGWTHLALVRNGNSCNFYVNGTAEGGTADVTGVNFDGGAAMVLYFSNEAVDDTNTLKGYEDEIRVSKGVARWTGNFTAPSGPYY